MRPTSLFATLALTSSCHVKPESFLPADASAHAEPASEHLNGTRHAFLVLGDERSFVWPAMLQSMLDAHASHGALYPIENVSAPAASVSTWTQASTRELRARLAPATAANASLPRTALCLVTLAGIGDELGPVKGEHDMVGAEMGANALERLALELHQAGVERVVFATPVFTAEAGAELSLEHLAIQRLLERGHRFIEAGPDVFRASRRYYPDAYVAGGTEPNEFGLKLVAEEWYRWLAGPEAREDVVEGLYATDFDVEGLRSAFVAEHGLPTP